MFLAYIHIAMVHVSKTDLGLSPKSMFIKRISIEPALNKLSMLSWIPIRALTIQKTSHDYFRCGKQQSANMPLKGWWD